MTLILHFTLLSYDTITFLKFCLMMKIGKLNIIPTLQPWHPNARMLICKEIMKVVGLGRDGELTVLRQTAVGSTFFVLQRMNFGPSSGLGCCVKIKWLLSTLKGAALIPSILNGGGGPTGLSPFTLIA